MSVLPVLSTFSLSENECNCVIEDLFVKPFCGRSFADKYNVISNGRPTPLIPTLTYKTKTCTRYLKPQNYEAISWLCGCKKNEKLYCWPCLLFSTEKNVWSNSGVSDLNNLSNLQKRHELSQNHIISYLALKQFGQTKTENSLNELFKIKKEKHNELVRQNRHIVRCLIDVTCFLGENDLSFRRHDESAESSNRENYIELLNLLRNYDGMLDIHLKNCTVFSPLSNDIQNDLINSIVQVLVDEIKSEITDIPFVAIIMDETTDITNKCQLSTVLRYVNKTGEVQERFINFKDCSNDRTANAFAHQLFSTLQEYQCENKLIAQTYDGAAVIAGSHSDLQTLVKERCKQALFIHCYAHKMNSVLKNSVAYIKQCNIFFSSLSGLASFFSKSSKRTLALDEIGKKRSPPVAPARWIYNYKLVSTIIDHKEDLVCLFKTIVVNGDKWDSDSYNSARGFFSTFHDFDFNFLLLLFGSILPQANFIFNKLQKRCSDIRYCIFSFEGFIQHLDDMKNQFDNFWTQFEHAMCDDLDQLQSPSQSKRMRIDIVSDRKNSYRILYYEILDAIRGKIMQRFSDIDQLDFIALLDFKRFPHFSKNFPEEHFACLKKSYGQYFDFPLLRSQLTVVYSSAEFHKTNISDLLRYLYSADLIDVVPQVWKLVCLIITIPVTSASTERSFSALQRIKTYLQNSQVQNRLSGESMLTIERKLLLKMKNDPTFYDRVIDLFAQKNGHIDLTYKK